MFARSWQKHQKAINSPFPSVAPVLGFTLSFAPTLKHGIDRMQRMMLGATLELGPLPGEDASDAIEGQGSRSKESDAQRVAKPPLLHTSCRLA